MEILLWLFIPAVLLIPIWLIASSKPKKTEKPKDPIALMRETRRYRNEMNATAMAEWERLFDPIAKAALDAVKFTGDAIPMKEVSGDLIGFGSTIDRYCGMYYENDYRCRQDEWHETPRSVAQSRADSQALEREYQFWQAQNAAYKQQLSDQQYGQYLMNKSISRAHTVGDYESADQLQGHYRRMFSRPQA